MICNLILKNRHLLLYSVVLGCLLFLLKSLELHFIVINHAFEIYIGAIAIIFTSLGIWLALQLTKPKTEIRVVEKEVYLPNHHGNTINLTEIHKLGLSKRELEVLQLMAQGLSNREIALRIFVSLNTVKTHTAKVFEKMQVKRRTQAIEKAKRLNIIH